MNVREPLVTIEPWQVRGPRNKLNFRYFFNARDTLYDLHTSFPKGSRNTGLFPRNLRGLPVKSFAPRQRGAWIETNLPWI